MKWQESDSIEFKESLNELSGENGKSTDAIAALVSFSNLRGGTVYFGVKNDGAILGLSISEKTLRDVANRITDTTDPQIIAEVRIEEQDGKTILACIVGESDAKPHKYKNIPYLRSGSATKPMPDSVYTQMLAQRPANLDLTSQTISNTSVDDLSEKALARFKELLFKKNDNWKESSNQEILSDLLLMDNGKLTYASVLLLGKSSTIQKYIPQAELRYLWYALENDTEYSFHNRDTSSNQPIILQLDMLLSEIKTKIVNVQIGLFRVEVKEYETSVLQEAILNAIIHRDYRISY
jgi:ATP-dependent DNA helicase RecG